MLERLHIENIAIIRVLDVDLSQGFSVFTGETGAGKSIIIDSIGLLLGSKGDRTLIRNGERSALVSGTFSRLSAQVRQFLASAELLTEEEIAEEDTIVLQRTLILDGRSSVRCCGKPITLYLSVGYALYSEFHDMEELTKLRSEKDAEIAELRSRLQASQVDAKLAVQTAVQEKDSRIAAL